MDRAYYSDSITSFLKSKPSAILGVLAQNNAFELERSQRDAWLEEIAILQRSLQGFAGKVYFEFSIPRMGKRVDVVILIGAVIFVVEFKVGEKEFPSSALDQVWDYALDLKNFHEQSHNQFVCPILVATRARKRDLCVTSKIHNDRLLYPIKSNADQLVDVITEVLTFYVDKNIDCRSWETGRYCPTPTIIEAATALYNGHSVKDISRSDASAINLTETSHALSEIIRLSRQTSRKSICFVTGVPGAGKTLVGLNTAMSHFDRNNDLYSVFLSGNGPLVKILCEALARDKVNREKQCGRKFPKGEALREAKTFVQNVHHFRDDCLKDSGPPIEHVVLFDEAQRAWDKGQTCKFMRQKKKKEFEISEPEFLISCLDRHKDWAVVVCLVGGGQEINTGEAGIAEWVDSLERSYPDWDVYISPRLADSEYTAGESLEKLQKRTNVSYISELHLSVSMRSFRAENVSLLVKQLLDLDVNAARQTLYELKAKYPIVLARDVAMAKHWLRQQARGTERYGLVASSQAERLRPHAIDVRSPMDPIHWFLDGKEDVRSSYYLESPATEFDVQGLELDWVCLTWDGDFRYSTEGWMHHSFRGHRWLQIKQQTRKHYLKNAYRVLLTRARQGMVIVVPQGAESDPTRASTYYDPTFEYLKAIGFDVLCPG